MPREPRTLDEEIIAAQEAAVRSTLTDEDRLDRITDELRAGFDALSERGRRGLVLRIGPDATGRP